MVNYYQLGYNSRLVKQEDEIYWMDIKESIGMPEDGSNKKQIFSQSTPPTQNYQEGDLWFDISEDNHLYRANSKKEWESLRDGKIFSGQWEDLKDETGTKPDDNADVTQQALNDGAALDQATVNDYVLSDSRGYINPNILTADNINKGTLSKVLYQTHVTKKGIKISGFKGGMESYGKAVWFFDADGNLISPITAASDGITFESFLNSDGLRVDKKVDFNSEYDNGSVSSNTTINWLNGQNQKITLTADIILSFSNMGVGHKQLKVVQDSTGSRIPTLPTGLWPQGEIIPFSTEVNAIDILSIYYDGNNYFYQLSLNFK